MVRTSTTVTTRRTVPRPASVVTTTRTRRRRQNRTASQNTGAWVASQPFPTGGPVALTTPGDAFLKTAYAPPDFEDIPFQGVPDKFNGKVTVLSQKLSTTFTLDYTSSPTSSLWDVVLVQLPVPGVACFFGVVPAGAPITNLNIRCPGWLPSGASINPGLGGIVYTDTPTLFPGPPASGTSKQNFSAFRLVQNAIEIRPTDPMLTISGLIQLLKTNITRTADYRGDQGLMGDEGIPSVALKSSFSTQYKNGVYAVNKNNQPDWEFTPFTTQSAGVQDIFGPSGFNFTTRKDPLLAGPVPQPDPIDPFGAFALLGLGNLESTVIRLSGLPTANNADGLPCTKVSFNLRCWQTGEYAVNPNSLVYQFASHSPPEDPLALEAYRSVIDILPSAVTAAQNDTFWVTLLKSLGSGLMALPGIATKFFSGQYLGAARDIISNPAFTPRLVANLRRSRQRRRQNMSMAEFDAQSGVFAAQNGYFSPQWQRGRPVNNQWTHDIITVT